MGSGWWVEHAWSISPVYLGSWVFWVIFSICLHELGHGIAALWCGDDTPRSTGHMTLNPFVHMPPMSLLMFGIIGIAWGLMPVNPSNFRGRYDDAKVAFAGPFVNALLVLFAVFAGALWLRFNASFPDHVQHNVTTFFFVGALLNVVLLLFNLVPAPPLDGSRIVANFVPAYREFIFSERGAIVSAVAFVLLFMAGGRLLWPKAMLITEWLMDHAITLVSGSSVVPLIP